MRLGETNRSSTPGKGKLAKVRGSQQGWTRERDPQGSAVAAISAAVWAIRLRRGKSRGKQCHRSDIVVVPFSGVVVW